MRAMAPSMRSACVFAISTLLLLSLLAHPARAQDDEGGGDSPPVDLKSKGLILVKVYCLIIIFFATFLPGVSPYYLRWNNAFLVLGIQFAGGVFLATAMLHFLGDSNETFEERTTKTYPFAFMLAVSGYLMTMLADMTIKLIYARQPVATRPADGESKSSEADNLERGEDVKTCCGKRAEACKCPDELETPEVKNALNLALIQRASFGDALLLILALCFHSVFEGLAIGIAATKAEAWRNLWTVSLHKSFAAISMGIALLRMLPNRPLLTCATYAFAFAISSPIGVAIGIAINAETQGPTADWIYAISMGLAAGVFVYVAINHLITKGFVPNCKVKVDQPLYKFVAATLGAGVIFVVMIWD